MEFLAAMGLGGLLIAGLERWLRRKDQIADRQYREMREAYAGLLKALSDTPDPSGLLLNQTEGDVHYWVSRILLVCPKDAVEFWFNSANRSRTSMLANRDAIILNMRNDLERQN